MMETVEIVGLARLINRMSPVRRPDDYVLRSRRAELPPGARVAGIRAYQDVRGPDLLVLMRADGGDPFAYEGDFLARDEPRRAHVRDDGQARFQADDPAVFVQGRGGPHVEPVIVELGAGHDHLGRIDAVQANGF